MDEPETPLEPPRPEDPPEPDPALDPPTAPETELPPAPEAERLPPVEVTSRAWFEFPDGSEPDSPPESDDAEPDAEPIEEDFPDHPEPLIPPAPPPARPATPIQVPPPPNWPPAEAPLPLGPGPLPDLERIERRRAPFPQRAAPAPPEPARKPRHRRSWPMRILVWVVKAILIFIIGSVLWVSAYCFVGPPITLTMMGDIFAGHGVTKSWMPLDRIDPSMARAAIAAEDARFCEHHGFDYRAIAAAAARNASGKRRIRGGSTISQQTAKNVFLWQGGGYFRKGMEAWFTLLIENIWGKRRIMEVYLNVAETGIGTYGVNAGSMRYFKHDASRMSAREAAQIAAVLPLPKKRAGIDPKGFTRRYGNSITARIGVVRGDGLDACLR